MAFLALVRHGESEWNQLGLWTGKTDVSLTEKGRSEARQAAKQLFEIHWDAAFISGLKRSNETLQEIISTLQLANVPTSSDHALDERDYGNFAGLKKEEVEKEYGEDLFEKWHRSWDYPVPHGETLKDVYARVIPYYQKKILPLLEQNKNVLICAHGNSLRALVKYLENISDEDIAHLELKTGAVYVYEINTEGKIISKKIAN